MKLVGTVHWNKLLQKTSSYPSSALHARIFWNLAFNPGKSGTFSLYGEKTVCCSSSQAPDQFCWASAVWMICTCGGSKCLSLEMYVQRSWCLAHHECLLTSASGFLGQESLGEKYVLAVSYLCNSYTTQLHAPVIFCHCRSASCKIL